MDCVLRDNLIKVDYDLYSAAALEKGKKNNGTNILEIDQTGQYWVLYLVKGKNKKNRIYISVEYSELYKGRYD